MKDFGKHFMDYPKVYMEMLKQHQPKKIMCYCKISAL